MINVYLRKLRCAVETDEVGSDTPYVLVTTIDLASPVPRYEVVKYGPFDGVDSREEHFAQGIAHSFWGLSEGLPSNLTDPEAAVFVVTLMERDDGNADVLRGVVKGLVAASVAGSVGMGRRDRVAKLIRDVTSVVKTPTAFGLNLDDHVDTLELRFSAAELRAAESGTLVSKGVTFRGDGGEYTLTFEAIRSHAVIGAIRIKWLQLNAESGPLGLPVGIELPTFDGTGRTQPFQRGLVSWHPDTGANAVWGLIGQRWLQIGREGFGYPITDELDTVDGSGKFNHFKALQLAGKPDASIFWSPKAGAHEVYGAIRGKWADMGWEGSSLGFPTSAEHDHQGGRLQRFERGSLFWSPATGVVVR